MSHIFRPEVNVASLENVRTRLVQLQESILYFLRSINPDAPSNVSWPDLHSKFNVLIAKYLQLTNILADPTNEGRPTPLKHYTVYPHETPLTDQQVQHLSVLLRTKLTPEVEKEDEERLREAYIPGLTQLIGSDERKTLAALRMNIAMHDAVCRKALEFFEEQRQEVLTRVRYESGDEQTHGHVTTSVEDKDRLEGEADFLSGKTDIVFRDEWSLGLSNAGFSSDEDEDEEDEESDMVHKTPNGGAEVSAGVDRQSWLYDSASSEDEEPTVMSTAVHQRASSQLGQHSWRVQGEDGQDDPNDDDEDEIMDEVPTTSEVQQPLDVQDVPQGSHMDVEEEGEEGDEESEEDFDTVMV